MNPANLVAKFRRSLATQGLLRTIWLCGALPINRARRWLQTLPFRLQGWWFDWRYGVDTRGTIELDTLTIESSNAGVGTHYQGSSNLNYVLRRLPIRYADFAFVDCGSGKGRALLIAARYPFREVIGVEFARELHAIAQRNIRDYRGMRKCPSVRSFWCDIVDYPIPSGPCLFYFFNPFHESILRQVLAKIRKSLDMVPRPVWIVGGYLVWRGLLDQATWLDHTMEIRRFPGFAVYRNREEAGSEARIALYQQPSTAARAKGGF